MENDNLSGPPFKYRRNHRTKVPAFPDINPASGQTRLKRTFRRPNQLQAIPPGPVQQAVLPEPEHQPISPEPEQQVQAVLPEQQPEQQVQAVLPEQQAGTSVPQRIMPDRRAKHKKKPDDGETLLCEDIAYGLLKPATIPVYGPHDVAVPEFTYIKTMMYANGIVFPEYEQCQCGPVCGPQCTCLLYNGENPYVDGRLYGYWAMIFECSHCECHKECVMRASQRENVQLQLFYAPGKGFGVRSSEVIRQGTCVAEYLGLMENYDNEAERSSYRFMISCLGLTREVVNNGELNEVEKYNGIQLALLKEDDKSEDYAFGVDAKMFGNVARFFNHSCDPNLFCQCIVYPSDQMSLSAKQARLVFFASRDIEAHEEITIDYNSEGAEELECQCDSSNCKKILRF